MPTTLSCEAWSEAAAGVFPTFEYQNRVGYTEMATPTTEAISHDSTTSVRCTTNQEYFNCHM